MYARIYIHIYSAAVGTLRVIENTAAAKYNEYSHAVEFNMDKRNTYRENHVVRICNIYLYLYIGM